MYTASRAARDRRQGKGHLRGLGDSLLLEPHHLTFVQQGKDQTHGPTRRQDQRALVLVLGDLVELAFVESSIVILISLQGVSRLGRTGNAGRDGAHEPGGGRRPRRASAAPGWGRAPLFPASTYVTTTTSTPAVSCIVSARRCTSPEPNARGVEPALGAPMTSASAST